jgi:hypothetical protein
MRIKLSTNSTTSPHGDGRQPFVSIRILIPYARWRNTDHPVMPFLIFAD